MTISARKTQRIPCCLTDNMAWTLRLPQGSALAAHAQASMTPWGSSLSLWTKAIPCLPQTSHSSSVPKPSPGCFQTATVWLGLHDEPKVQALSLTLPSTHPCFPPAPALSLAPGQALPLHLLLLASLPANISLLNTAIGEKMPTLITAEPFRTSIPSTLPKPTFLSSLTHHHQAQDLGRYVLRGPKTCCPPSSWLQSPFESPLVAYDTVFP